MKWPFSRFKVFGNSMLPVLKPDQDVLCFNWAYIFAKPEAGDIVVVLREKRNIIKRVLKVYDQGVYVLGDNKKESTDSRSFGPVKRPDILGKVVWSG